MKIKTMAAATALLGTALLGYSQAPDKKPGNTGSIGGASGGVAEQAARNPDGTPRQAANETAELRTIRDMDWYDAEEADVDFDELPATVRTSFTNASSGAEIDDKVVRLTKDGHQVYRATATRDGQEDSIVYVRDDGTLVRTERKIEYKQAPANIRATITEEWGADAEPVEFRQVTADQRRYYIAKSDAAAGNTTLRIDAEGNIMPEPAKTPAATGRTGADPREATETDIDE